MNEEWRVVPSFPSYLASSLGRIRGPSGKVLKTRGDRKGYLQFNACRDGGIYCARVARCVCEAFHGPAPTPDHEAAHWDGSVDNNVPGNLRWATALENANDRRRHGTILAREAHPRAQLTEEQVAEIKRVYAEKCATYIKRGTRQRLAEKFGVKVSLIKDIVGNRSWVES